MCGVTQHEETGCHKSIPCGHTSPGRIGSVAWCLAPNIQCGRHLISCSKEGNFVAVECSVAQWLELELLIALPYGVKGIVRPSRWTWFDLVATSIFWRQCLLKWLRGSPSTAGLGGNDREGIHVFLHGPQSSDIIGTVVFCSSSDLCEIHGGLPWPAEASCDAKTPNVSRGSWIGWLVNW